nr:unnamed protein product [Callosobruchus analis]
MDSKAQSGSKDDEQTEQKRRPGGNSRSSENVSQRTLTHSRSAEDLRSQFRNVSSMQGPSSFRNLICEVIDKMNRKFENSNESTNVIFPFFYG